MVSILTRQKLQTQTTTIQTVLKRYTNPTNTRQLLIRTQDRKKTLYPDRKFLPQSTFFRVGFRTQKKVEKKETSRIFPVAKLVSCL
mmetsp:Transcript_3335/g.3699  ORF Transcript_3335/g.3699 Transcript_3335/m.3699 type:complete len:86 (+) Transcript_3335:88-345(+)